MAWQWFVLHLLTGVFWHVLFLTGGRPTLLLQFRNLTSLSNCWPISVLPVVSKILEHFVFDAIVYNLHERDLLSPKQSGFRPGQSTLDVLLHVTDSWLKQTELMVGSLWLLFFLIWPKRLIVLTMIYCVDHDIYYCIDHDVLFQKVRCYGVWGSTFKLM